MATGISIHVGVNRVDTTYYGDSFPVLEGAEADAIDMAAMAEIAGFGERTLLLGREATAGAVKAAIQDAIRRLAPGDLLLISFAGHGSRRLDSLVTGDGNLYLDGDEGEGEYDETWCTYDRDIVDDELYALWADAAAGTRIVVVSDSCFSGDIVRDAELTAVLALGADDEEDQEDDEYEVTRSWVDPFEEARRHGLIPRGVPYEVQREVSERHACEYREEKRAAAFQKRPALQASVLLLSACSQNELAVEKDGHGVFTRVLLEAWHAEELSGGYSGLHRSVVKQMKALLRAAKTRPTPRCRFADGENPEFLGQDPFFIDQDVWDGRALRIRSAVPGTLHQA